MGRKELEKGEGGGRKEGGDVGEEGDAERVEEMKQPEYTWYQLYKVI